MSPSAARDYYQAWSELRRDLPITYLYNARNIVAMSAKLQRFPADPGRHDPHSGHGDGEVVRGHLGTRIAQIIPTLLLVSVLVFCLQQLMPGDPALVLAGEERGDPQVLAQIRAELWLDRSLPVQYLHWMGNVLQGDLGYSWRIRQPVSQLVLQKLPVTLQLGVDGVRIRGADRRAGWHRRGGVPQSIAGIMSPTRSGWRDCPRRRSGSASC